MPRRGSLTANTFTLDLTAQAWGELRESNDDLNDADVLRQRMHDEGYLFFRGLLEAAQVREARSEALRELASKQLITTEASSGEPYSLRPQPFRDLSPGTARLPAAEALSRSDRLLAVFRSLLEGEVRTHDLFFRRALSPKSDSETPHCDICFMGHGTHQLYTAWMPLGDIPLEQGPLMILEKSNHSERQLSRYWNWDADADGKRIRFKHGFLFRGGHYSKHPPAVQREFDLRWLSTDFRTGDVLMFSAFTMHASLDNRSNDVRLSIDRRYQLASNPVDPRWNGENPAGNVRLQRDILSDLNVPYRLLRRLLHRA